MMTIFVVLIIIILAICIIGLPCFLESVYGDYLVHRNPTDTGVPDLKGHIFYGEMPRITFSEFIDYYNKNPDRWTFSRSGKEIILSPYYVDQYYKYHYVYFKTLTDFYKYRKFCKKRQILTQKERFQKTRENNTKLFKERISGE